MYDDKMMALLSIQTVIVIVVGLIAVGLMFVLLTKVLKIIRRKDVIEKGAIMSSVLSLGGFFITLVAYILMVKFIVILPQVAIIIMAAMCQFISVYIMTHYLNKKLYFESKEAITIAISNGGIMAACAVIIFL